MVISCQEDTCNHSDPYLGKQAIAALTCDLIKDCPDNFMGLITCFRINTKVNSHS